MICIEDIELGYGERTLISQPGEVTFADGALTALIGRNGTGKSTLLRAIAGLNRRYSGRILIDGEDIRSLDAVEMARRLAFVTTERTRIASIKCEDIVAVGRSPYTNWIGRMTARDRNMVYEALAAVGMTAYARRSMLTMSDGECQRIMIARALAQETPTILLDEPTSFLDMPGRYELADLLNRLAHEEGKCIIFSTHELDIATGRTDTCALLAGRRLLHLPSGEMPAVLTASGFFTPGS